MNATRLLAETAKTVTISRSDLDALIDAAENAEDIASVRAWNAYVAAAGRDAAIANTYTDAEAKCLLDGESPVRIWREKRGMTQQASPRPRSKSAVLRLAGKSDLPASRGKRRGGGTAEGSRTSEDSGYAGL
jgi:hypothetical protein